MAEDEEIPGYMRRLSNGGPIELDDGFGPEDITWTGDDLDAEELTVEYGQDPYDLFHFLMFALIKGSDPNVRLGLSVIRVF